MEVLKCSFSFFTHRWRELIRDRLTLPASSGESAGTRKHIPSFNEVQISRFELSRPGKLAAGIVS